MNYVASNFTRHGISTTSLSAAVQDVRSYIEQSAQRATQLIFDLIGVRVEFTDLETAIVTAQAIVENIFKSDLAFDEPNAVLEAAKVRCDKLMNDPKRAWVHDKSDSQFGQKPSTPNGQMAKVSASVDVVVEVKSDGQIKKGGKQVLADALYKKHVLEAETPLTNQEFIALLQKDLQMTKSGSTTYAYNCRNKYGQVNKRV